VKPAEPEKVYTDKDFVKCSCGRLIPVSRKKCAYCNKINPNYVAEPDKKKKK
jgi:hypothetical protein